MCICYAIEMTAVMMYNFGGDRHYSLLIFPSNFMLCISKYIIFILMINKFHFRQQIFFFAEINQVNVRVNRDLVWWLRNALSRPRMQKEHGFPPSQHFQGIWSSDISWPSTNTSARWMVAMHEKVRHEDRIRKKQWK